MQVSPSLLAADNLEPYELYLLVDLCCIDLQVSGCLASSITIPEEKKKNLNEEPRQIHMYAHKWR